MTFFLPWMLVGLIGMAIPIGVHLWHRRSARRVKWGAMQFLAARAVPGERRNVKHWVLLAMRMGAIAVIALALARPRVLASRVPRTWLKDSPVDVAIVIDRSLSTGRTSEGETVFGRSIDAADEILRQLRPGDGACVILAEHSARIMGGGLLRGADSAGISTLRWELRAMGPGMTDCSIPEAIGVARRTLEGGGAVNKIVLVVSGNHASQWHLHDEAAWGAAVGASAVAEGGSLAKESIETYSMPIRPDAQFSDASVSEIRVEPAVVGTGRPIHVRCMVANAGTRPLPALSARLRIDDAEIDNRPVPALPPKGSMAVTFDLERGITQAGSHRIMISVDAHDGLAADDQTLATINVVDKIPVLIVDGSFSRAGDPESSRFLGAAMRPDEFSVIAPTIVSLAELAEMKVGDYRAVVLNDCPTLPQVQQDALIGYVGAGHGLWCILGARTGPDFVDRSLNNTGLFPARTSGVHQAVGAGEAAVVKDPSSPVVTAIAGASRNALLGARVWAWWAVEPTDPATQVVIAGAAGEPLVMERPVGAAGGAIVIWATSADGTWNNWNLMPNYVPMVIETIQHLGAGPLESSARALRAGQPIEWAGDSEHPVAGATMARPDGTTIWRPAILNDGRSLITCADTFQPGFYRLNFGSGPTAPTDYAVNIDPSLLDSGQIDSDDVRWLVVHAALDGARPVVEQDQLADLLRPRADKVEISAVLGVVLLFMLIAESALAYQMTRSGTSQPGTTDSAGRPGLTGSHERQEITI